MDVVLPDRRCVEAERFAKSVDDLRVVALVREDRALFRECALCRLEVRNVHGASGLEALGADRAARLAGVCWVAFSTLRVRSGCGKRAESAITP